MNQDRTKKFFKKVGFIKRWKKRKSGMKQKKITKLSIKRTKIFQI